MNRVESREWYLSKHRREGIPTSEDLKLRTQTLSIGVDSIPDEHIAIRTLWLSLDPYLRSRMTGRQDGLYSSQFAVGQVIEGFGIGKVIQSRSSDFAEDDIVINPFCPFAEYCVIPATNFLRKIATSPGISLPDHLNSLGLPGFTAWVGIHVLGNPKPGSIVFISAAAGGVGMYAGQLANLKGCRVVGSTGSDDKVKLVKEEFGYHDAFNYRKEADLDAALSKFFPDGIDIYFDNVGGNMLEAVLNHVNKGARITLCGMISQYNKIWTEREGVRNLLNMVGKEVRMEGFMVGSYLDRFGEFTKEMEGYMKQGKINSKFQTYHGIESFLDGLVSLFSTSNSGKAIIQV